MSNMRKQVCKLRAGLVGWFLSTEELVDSSWLSSISWSTSQISNMTFHLFSVVLLLCATPLNCAVNKCTNEQTCVEINKCREWCARIEDIGSVSNLSEDEKAQFRKSICGFRKDDVLICCEAQSESPVCDIRKKNTLDHSCGKIKVNRFVTLGRFASFSNQL